jgi:hypothetical protein
MVVRANIEVMAATIRHVKLGVTVRHQERGNTVGHAPQPPALLRYRFVIVARTCYAVSVIRALNLRVRRRWPSPRMGSRGTHPPEDGRPCCQEWSRAAAGRHSGLLGRPASGGVAGRNGRGRSPTPALDHSGTSSKASRQHRWRACRAAQRTPLLAHNRRTTEEQQKNRRAPCRRSFTTQQTRDPFAFESILLRLIRLNTVLGPVHSRR